METSFASLAHDWHDFYVLVGTASATLVGLMFVTASVGASVFNKDHVGPLNAFLTPTVVHFSAALLICVFAVVPSQTWRSMAATLGLIGAAGGGYSIVVWVRIFARFSVGIDLTDRMFYGLVPVVAYLMVLGAGTAFWGGSPWSVDVLAAAVLAMLLAGIRNAWDMTIWIVTRTPPGS